MKQQFSLEPVEYILEEDRGEPVEEQVVFWVKPLKVRESVKMVSDLASVSSQRRGRTEVSAKRLMKSEMDGWLRALTKIDNYPPSADFDQYLPESFNLKAILGEDGRIETTDDPDVLSAIGEDLMLDQREEVTEVRANFSRLERGTRKK